MNLLMKISSLNQHSFGTYFFPSTLLVTQGTKSNKTCPLLFRKLGFIQMSLEYISWPSCSLNIEKVCEKDSLESMFGKSECLGKEPRISMYTKIWEFWCLRGKECKEFLPKILGLEGMLITSVTTQLYRWEAEDQRVNINCMMSHSCLGLQVSYLISPMLAKGKK